jgi:two-component system chemotaxis response regulator CheY
MPDLNGLELLRFVRQSARHRELPVVVVSSEASPADRARGQALGASAWLAKPFDPEELAALAQRWLGPG